MKLVHKMLIQLLLIIVMNLIWYASVTFVTLQTNPLLWSELARITTVCAELIIIYLSTIIYVIEK